MQDLFMADCQHGYLYLDNVEISLKQKSSFRSLGRKLSRVTIFIEQMLDEHTDRALIIDQSVELITAELRPSQFGYVCAMIASEFSAVFLRWVRAKTLKEEVGGAVRACEPVFEALRFNVHTKEQHHIYTLVKNCIKHYLKTSRRCIAPLPKKAAALPAAPVTELEPIRLREPVDYFDSDLLKMPVVAKKTARKVKPVSLPTFKPNETMANTQYPINKGINKSIVFKGLKAQYIAYMGVGLLIDLICYAVLYLLKVNTYLTLALTLALGAVIMLAVYHLNDHYGEHGLLKALAKRSTPKRVKSISRKIFQRP